ncbi:hypothetical protein D3Y57_02485 (plasmid) [Sphingomonas paeninsulae]|uniref:Uncharacterized protein n=1 Tax=Sphingomonas paeninsulae TaxID=2319844 RepID=A0A494TIG7_SPHPE|nr:hypothetical protein [Sphingomonas paeninsulae]AYJ84945.1 hypothetical protein D3Y57_02485 [Sphingomonas paeninsulae]
MTIGFVLTLFEDDEETRRAHQLRPNDLVAWADISETREHRASRVHRIAQYLATEMVCFLDERDGLKVGPYPMYERGNLQ